MPQPWQNCKGIDFLVLSSKLYICKLTKKSQMPNSNYFNQKSHEFEPLFLAKKFLSKI